MRLFLIVMIVVVSRSPLFADDGTVYPDSARISFTRVVNDDTVIVTIVNLGSDSLSNIFISEHTAAEPIFVGCSIDGNPVDPVQTESEWETVFPERFTTRWVLGDFGQIAVLKYYSVSNHGALVTVCGGHPYPFFGLFRGIGSPEEVNWRQ